MKKVKSTGVEELQIKSKKPFGLASRALKETKKIKSSKGKNTKRKIKNKNPIEDENIEKKLRKNKSIEVVKTEKKVKKKKLVKAENVQKTVLEETVVPTDKQKMELTASDFDSLSVQNRMRSISALRKASETSKFENVFSDTGAVRLLVALFKIPEVPSGKIRAPISLKLNVRYPFRQGQQVLLITQDRKKKCPLRSDFEPNIIHYKNLLADHKAKHLVTEVMPLNQLKRDYKDFEAKRQLCDMYDVVLCDETIFRRVPMFLGKKFYKTKKRPISVNLKSSNLKRELQKAVDRSYCHLDLTGNTFSVQVGTLEQKDVELSANIGTIYGQLAEKVPGKMENIQSIYITAGSSPAIPLYISTASRENIPEVEHPNYDPVKEHGEWVVDEGPTGKKVKVHLMSGEVIELK